MVNNETTVITRNTEKNVRKLHVVKIVAFIRRKKPNRMLPKPPKWYTGEITFCYVRREQKKPNAQHVFFFFKRFKRSSEMYIQNKTIQKLSYFLQNSSRQH